MSTRESSLWTWLSGAKRIARDKLDMHRIENSLESGMPDVEGCYNGASFWLELKSIDIPKKDTTHFNHTLTPEQISWIHTRTKAGGAVGVLIRAKPYRLLLAGRWILIAQEPRTFKDFVSYCEDVSDEEPIEVISRLLRHAQCPR